MSLFPRFAQEFSPLFRLMDDYERHAFRNVNQSLRTFSPKFDVKELKDSYELHGEFPGIEQKNINIEWTDANTLTISGRQETVREEGERPQGLIKESGESSTENQDEHNHNHNHNHQPTVEDEGADNEASTTKTQTQVAKQSNQQQVVNHDDNSNNNNAPKFWVSERSVGEFHRSFNFPARVDQDAVKASLKDGILSIVVPKAQAPKPRKINIE